MCTGCNKGRKTAPRKFNIPVRKVDAKKPLNTPAPRPVNKRSVAITQAPEKPAPKPAVPRDLTQTKQAPPSQAPPMRQAPPSRQTGERALTKTRDSRLKKL